MDQPGDETSVTAAAVTRHLWLQALAELGPRRADCWWYPTADDLRPLTLRGGRDDRSLLSLINQALALQQFLLEVACRPTRVGDRTAIVRQAARLLNQNLRTTAT